MCAEPLAARGPGGFCHGNGDLRRAAVLAHSGGVPALAGPRGAVSAGLAHTGGLITATAALIVAASAGFALVDLMVIKAIGVSMGVAVVVDATGMRMLLVPATMRLLGRWNWWPPARLSRWCLPPAREPGRFVFDGALIPGSRQHPARPSRTP